MELAKEFEGSKIKEAQDFADKLYRTLMKKLEYSEMQEMKDYISFAAKYKCEVFMKQLYSNEQETVVSIGLRIIRFK